MFTGFECVVHLDKIASCPSYGDVIGLNDGRLMWACGSGSARQPLQPLRANYSSDGGRSWSDPEPLRLTTGEPLPSVFQVSLLRLASGALGLVHTADFETGAHECDQRGLNLFHVSEDEGRTFSPPVTIGPPGDRVYLSNGQGLVLGEGRIIIPVSSFIGPVPNPDLPSPKRVVRRGMDLGVAAPRCGMAYSFAYYSDDGGATWTRSRNEAFAMLDRSVRGCYAMCEPAVVELKDGRLLMIGRTNLGRYYQSFSSDHGETWLEPEPTDLALLPSPCALQRIPTTGDLLVIWNPTSRAEAALGLYRHRLTCAISKDGGKTWQNHRNLESLDDVAYIEPDEPETLLLGRMRQPTDRKRYRHAPGALRCNQPTCTFFDDKAIITYGFCVFGDKEVIRDEFGIEFDQLMEKLGLAPYERGNKVRVLPIDWFYG